MTVFYRKINISDSSANGGEFFTQIFSGRSLNSQRREHQATLARTVVSRFNLPAEKADEIISDLEHRFQQNIARTARFGVRVFIPEDGGKSSLLPILEINHTPKERFIDFISVVAAKFANK